MRLVGSVAVYASAKKIIVLVQRRQVGEEAEKMNKMQKDVCFPFNIKTSER